MALDGVLLYGLARELESVLAGSRIEKIQQPETDEIHLTIRKNRSNYRLLLSASASNPRIHLTQQNKTNPLVPPMFCMVLRKHLSGARLLSVRQPDMERILELSFEAIDELGDLSKKTLIIEIMGRHSNIMLTGSNGTILDAVKHVDQSISRVREVLPGRQYIYPPSQGKSNPLHAEAADVKHKLQTAEPGSLPASIITKFYTGISRATADEICYRGGADPAETAAAFVSFFQEIRNNEFRPTLLMDDSGKPMDILPMPYSIYHSALLKECSSFSEALDEFFLVRDQMERIKQRTSHLHRVIRNNLDRCQKKLASQTEELENARESEKYRLFGELITSNIYQIPARKDKVSLHNYYDPDNSMIIIPLDPAKTPAQNAQSYFRQYNKARTVLEKQSRFMKETLEEIDYLESISQSLSMCIDENDISEIREELTREGYIKERPNRPGLKGNKSISKPHHFLSSDGFEIFVGKNNIQNDQLTMKTASSNDLWLHTKTIHGSHVIVRTGGASVPETTLLEAANLAAYYSKGRSSSNVPVDYCPRKNVKKPNGAKPGMVIYEQYNTIYITPSEEMVLSMKRL